MRVLEQLVASETVSWQAIDRNRKAIENRIRYFQKEEATTCAACEAPRPFCGADESLSVEAYGGYTATRPYARPEA